MINLRKTVESEAFIISIILLGLTLLLGFILYKAHQSDKEIEKIETEEKAQYDARLDNIEADIEEIKEILCSTRKKN